MECHRCKNRESVEAGKYSRMPFGNTPCAKCDLREDSAHTLAYDECLAAPVTQAAFDEPDEPEELFPSSVVQEIITVLLTMPRVVRDAVCWRYAGFKYRDISVVQEVTMAGAEIRVRRALRRWPVLQALFPEKIAKQAVRRRKAGSEDGRQETIDLGP